MKKQKQQNVQTTKTACVTCVVCSSDPLTAFNLAWGNASHPTRYYPSSPESVLTVLRTMVNPLNPAFVEAVDSTCDTIPAFYYVLRVQFSLSYRGEVCVNVLIFL